MPGTDTMATDTVAGDTEATTGLMATMATTERGLQMPSLSPQLRLSPMLMLIRGTAMATVDMDGVDTTGPMDMGVTGEVTGLSKPTEKWTHLQIAIFVDISQYFQSLRLVWAAGVCLVG